MTRASKRLASITVDRIRKADGARAYEKAYEKACETAKAPPDPTKAVRLTDGEGLYLIVEPTGSARWVFLFRWDGKLKEMGFGGLSKVSLQAARDKAQEAREQLGARKSPLEAKRVKEAIPTFGAIADELIRDKSAGFKNPKHAASWERAIGAPRPTKVQKLGKWVDGKPRPSFAEPLRSKPVDTITSTDVLAVLKPLWATRHETAARLRGQIAKVLDRAKAADYRTGDNPAAWAGNLEPRLPARRKLTQGHRPALPYMDVPAFMAALRARPALSARALEFTILTACRTSEVLGMTWAEVDLDAKIWTVPAERMKRGVEHRVPLSDAAVAILTPVALLSNRRLDAVVFPGNKAKLPLSDAAMMALIKRMGHPTISAHGFRSSFRDWAGDATSYPRDIAEQALAHAVGNEVELAYRRSDALERRRKMMDSWATFCAGGAQIVELVKSA